MWTQKIKVPFTIAILFSFVVTGEIKENVPTPSVNANDLWKQNITAKKPEAESILRAIINNCTTNETGQSKMRELILASELGFLAGFMGGSFISVLLCIFRFNGKRTLAYDKRINSYKAADNSCVNEFKL